MTKTLLKNVSKAALFFSDKQDMNAWALILFFIGFGLFVVLFLFESQKNHLRDAEGNLKGNVRKRFQLMPLMITIIKDCYPEHGVLIEKVVSMQLTIASNHEGSKSDFLKLDIFQNLLGLIQSKSHSPNYETYKDFQRRFDEIEMVIEGAEKYYVSVAHSYNKFVHHPLLKFIATTLKYEVHVIYLPPQINVILNSAEDTLMKLESVS
jgi:hypothetical protein